MVKQYRSDGTEIRDGESAVPGYIPFHLRPAIAEGEAASPVCGDPDPSVWLEAPPPELMDGVTDPGEPPPEPTLSYLEASEANIERILDLLSSPLIHDRYHAPVTAKEKISLLILALNRIAWRELEEKTP